jgi:hypothetical protein
MRRSLTPVMQCLALCARAIAADTADPARSPVLDVFPDGQWKGMNAVFQAKDFDATLDKDRVMRITPKLDGKPAGMPVLVRFSAYYSVDGTSHVLDMVSLEKRPVPAMQPKKVEFAGHFERKIKFTFAIQFSEKGVAVEGDVVDPPGLKYPTIFAYAAYFTATHQIPPTAFAEEIRKLTEGFTVKFTDARRQSDVKQFWEVEKTRPGVVASAEVTGPWATRRVICELPPTPKNGRRAGNYGNYAMTPFYKGGWYFSRGGTDKVPGGPITVRVE